MSLKLADSITVFSKENCSQCVMLKNILKAKKIEFIEQQLDKDYVVEDLVLWFDTQNIVLPRTFPVVFKGNEFIGGLAEVRNKIASGEI